MPSRLPIVLCAVIFSTGLLGSVTSRAGRAQAAPLLYTVAREYRPTAWLRGAERFPRGAAILITDQHQRKPLVPDFVATSDADVSFDGSRVLFAGRRRPLDHWQIWEASVPAGDVRQITRCDDDCVRPLHVPPDAVVYAHKVAGRFVLETAQVGVPDAKALRLTFAPGNFLPVDVLQDGRVLFEGAYPPDDNPISELYTVYTDGSGVESYRCDHGHSRYSGRQLSTGDIVFAREGRIFRFTSALAHEIVVRAPAGDYAGEIVETSEGTWLVSWRGAGQQHFQLRTWKPGAATLQPHVSEPDASIVQPVLLTGRRTPDRHPSGLHDWPHANVLCLNAYTSKHRFTEGSIASIRLYTRDDSGATRLLGQAQVEKDGSFYVRVPGDQPLKIEMLDSSGITLKKEAGWFWVRAGEQRVCVGCHAGPETAPENTVPAVLRRSTVPVDMTGGNPRPARGGD